MDHRTYFHSGPSSASPPLASNPFAFSDLTNHLNWPLEQTDPSLLSPQVLEQFPFHLASSPLPSSDYPPPTNPYEMRLASSDEQLLYDQLETHQGGFAFDVGLSQQQAFRPHPPQSSHPHHPQHQPNRFGFAPSPFPFPFPSGVAGRVLGLPGLGPVGSTEDDSSSGGGSSIAQPELAFDTARVEEASFASSRSGLSPHPTFPTEDFAQSQSFHSHLSGATFLITSMHNEPGPPPPIPPHELMPPPAPKRRAEAQLQAKPRTEQAPGTPRPQTSSLMPSPAISQGDGPGPGPAKGERQPDPKPRAFTRPAPRPGSLAESIPEPKAGTWVGSAVKVELLELQAEYSAAAQELEAADPAARRDSSTPNPSLLRAHAPPTRIKLEEATWDEEDPEVKSEILHLPGQLSSLSASPACSPTHPQPPLFSANELVKDKDAKDFPCVFPACKKVFKRFEHLKRHTLMHTGEKHHSCPICSKYFSRSDNLMQHTKIHAKEKNRKRLTPEQIAVLEEQLAFFEQSSRGDKSKRTLPKKRESKAGSGSSKSAPRSRSSFEAIEEDDDDADSQSTPEDSDMEDNDSLHENEPQQQDTPRKAEKRKGKQDADSDTAPHFKSAALEQDSILFLELNPVN